MIIVNNPTAGELTIRTNGMKSANIIKFETGKVIIYPLIFIKDGGSYATTPFVVKENMTYQEMAQSFQETLELSKVKMKPPIGEESFFSKENMKLMGITSMKMFHDGSMNIGVFVKDANFNIAPTINKGPKKGFLYTKKRFKIPIDSSLSEIAEVLKKTFGECS